MRRENEEVRLESCDEFPRFYIKIYDEEICPGRTIEECRGKHAHIHNICTDTRVSEHLSWCGYDMVGIRNKDKIKMDMYVHQFSAFVGKGRGYDEGKVEEICHLDGIKEHNAPHNLKFDTKRKNAEQLVEHNAAKKLRLDL